MTKTDVDYFRDALRIKQAELALRSRTRENIAIERSADTLEEVAGAKSAGEDSPLRGHPNSSRRRKQLVVSYLPVALPDSIFTGLSGGRLPLGMRTHPFLPILYVDITPVSKVAVYTYDPQGRLNFVRAVPDAGAAPCWAVVNHAGTYLYVTNTGDNSIEVYSLADPLNPTEVQHFVMDSNNGGAVFSTVIDRSDNWLYVSRYRPPFLRMQATLPDSEQSSPSASVSANAFHTLKIGANGMLSEPFAPTVLPVTSTPAVRVQGITVF